MGQIAAYAWRDHYAELRVALGAIADRLREAGHRTRVLVDDNALVDREAAYRAGLGWYGKNANLLLPGRGSWFVLGSVLTDADLPAGTPLDDGCGTCTRCIDACPTNALAPYQIDATKCISYLTIELREDIPESFHDKMEGWAYGCDICQEVCPWNRFSKAHTGEDFKSLDYILSFSSEDWQELDHRTFKKLTRHSAMNRIKWDKMKDNLRISGYLK